MKPVILLSLLWSIYAADAIEAEKERFTLADGRVLVGWWNDDTSSLTLEAKGKARIEITLKPEQIAKRELVHERAREKSPDELLHDVDQAQKENARRSQDDAREQAEQRKAAILAEAARAKQEDDQRRAVAEAQEKAHQEKLAAETYTAEQLAEAAKRRAAADAQEQRDRDQAAEQQAKKQAIIDEYWERLQVAAKAVDAKPESVTEISPRWDLPKALGGQVFANLDGADQIRFVDDGWISVQNGQETTIAHCFLVTLVKDTAYYFDFYIDKDRGRFLRNPERIRAVLEFHEHPDTKATATTLTMARCDRHGAPIKGQMVRYISTGP